MRWGKKMPHYIVLVKLTEKGAENFKQGWTKDRPKVKAQVQKMGGTMTGYMTFGQYDIVELLELPDDKAAAIRNDGRSNWSRNHHDSQSLLRRRS